MKVQMTKFFIFVIEYAGTICSTGMFWGYVCYLMDKVGKRLDQTKFKKN